ncbi:hypothetical protein [Rhizobium sp. BK176]|uniref:hypothetical protein n=1 Tax=Rhizobium sp. BK176 TaxID=2587071 RepID=UPI0021679096|nr:hypothetical protein [Rhizobium sp. BK176]MCS4089385.1 hypothetical protein [Rhizobium sp. BK176]
MVDGIGAQTGLWRGRAAYQAGPAPAGSAIPKRENARTVEPFGLPVSGNRFLRYEMALPLLPGDRLATVVASRRPDAAHLLRDATPHWDKLRSSGARTRELFKSDTEVMQDLLSDAAREFQALLEAGLCQEAKSLSGIMDFIERVVSELPGYPALEDAVIEAARRTLAFVEHAEPAVDYLAAGGMSLFRERGAASLRVPEQDDFPGARTTPHPSPVSKGHPFLGPWPAHREMQTGDFHGIDPETGEECLTARGPRELGILLADLCKDGDIELNVKSCVPHGKPSGQLGLWTRLAARRRMVETVTLTLPRGLSPEESLIRFADTAPNFEFPVWSKPFFVSPAVSYSHVQDFMVDSGSVLFSYVSGADPVPGLRRFDGQLLCPSDADAMNVDAPITGVLVADRGIAAKLARRVLRHARSAWARNAPPHRVRAALTTTGEAVVVAVHVCGSEPYYGIPYDRMWLALKNRRERYLSNLHRNPLLVRKFKFRNLSSSRARRIHCDEPKPTLPVLEQQWCERTARRILAGGEGTGMRRTGTQDEFLLAIAVALERNPPLGARTGLHSAPNEFDFEG